MIPDAAILECIEALLAIARTHGANNLRFFGEVVSEHPRIDCGVDLLVDFEHGRRIQENIQALEAGFSRILGRMVTVKTPDMFIPPILELVLDEVVHADVFLHRNAGHLQGSPVDAEVLDHRLELLVLLRRYGVEHARLIGEIVRPGHRPDCGIQILVDRHNSRFDWRELPYLELRLGSLLGRVVKVFTPDMIFPPLSREELQNAIPL